MSATILVVDDDRVTLTLVERTLRSGGYRVWTAGGAAEARRLLEDLAGAVDLQSDPRGACDVTASIILEIPDSERPQPMPERRCVIVAGFPRSDTSWLAKSLSFAGDSPVTVSPTT